MVAGDGEVMLFSALGSGLVGVVRTLPPADFGFRTSDFFRISDFGLRIWEAGAWWYCRNTPGCRASGDLQLSLQALECIKEGQKEG
jgi:hypothetical protein